MVKTEKKKKDKQIYMATGRRKEAVARIYLRNGSGKIFINGRRLEEYFKHNEHQSIIESPFKVTKTLGNFDLKVKVNGGGISGQAGAVLLGIARALEKVDENNREVLKDNGFLTRDPRVKERKKYGKKRARKSFQFSKR